MENWAATLPWDGATCSSSVGSVCPHSGRQEVWSSSFSPSVLLVLDVGVLFVQVMLPL